MTGKKPLKGNRLINVKTATGESRSFVWGDAEERDAVLVEMRGIGLTWREIAKYTGLTHGTVRTMAYAARRKNGAPRRWNAPSVALVGNRTVRFVKDGATITKVWATAEERTAVLIEMLSTGMMLKQATDTLGIRSTSAGRWLREAGYKAVDLRNHDCGMRNLWVRCETADVITRYAAKTGRTVAPALHEIVTAGLSALGVAT